MRKIFFIAVLSLILPYNLYAQESNKVIFTLHDQPNSSYLLSIAEPLDGSFNSNAATFKQTITDNVVSMQICRIVIAKLRGTTI